MNCIAYSPDGKTLAAGCGTGVICLWEVSTAKVRAVLAGHRDSISSLDFSPDGARLISGSRDATALIWDLTGIADESDGKTLKPEMEIHYLQNDSNAPYYAFDKNIILFGIAFEF